MACTSHLGPFRATVAHNLALGSLLALIPPPMCPGPCPFQCNSAHTPATASFQSQSNPPLFSVFPNAIPPILAPFEANTKQKKKSVQSDANTAALEHIPTPGLGCKLHACYKCPPLSHPCTTNLQEVTRDVASSTMNPYPQFTL